MRKFLFFAAILMFPLSVSPALAQMSADVNLEQGKDSAALSGTVTGNEYMDYVLGAAGGQTMSVDLAVIDSNGSGTIYSNILPPGSDGEAIYIGSMDGNSASVDLPEDGDYTIRVYQMGNDKDTGKTTGFTTTVTIN